MNFNMIGRLAGALVLAAGLAGCIDMEIEVLSDTTAKVTTTTTVPADIYPMLKGGMEGMMGAAGQAAGAGTASTNFCEAGTVTENADGSATCVEVKEGEINALVSEEKGVHIEVVSPGVVKLTFSTAELQEQVASETAGMTGPPPGSPQTDAAPAPMDEEGKAMAMALFGDKTVTLRIKGKEIVETNMTKSADGTSAEVVIPFVDLISGTADLPAEFTATVKTN